MTGCKKNPFSYRVVHQNSLTSCPGQYLKTFNWLKNILVSLQPVLILKVVLNNERQIENSYQNFTYFLVKLVLVKQIIFLTLITHK